MPEEWKFHSTCDLRIELSRCKKCGLQLYPLIQVDEEPNVVVASCILGHEETFTIPIDPRHDEDLIKE